jgi:hypothetical protein
MVARIGNGVTEPTSIDMKRIETATSTLNFDARKTEFGGRAA